LYSEIEEIWIIARDINELNEVAKLYPNKKIIPISMDLSNMNEFSKIEDKLKQENAKIKLLINDAGVCSNGLFEEQDLNKMFTMIDLNCKGTTAMTKIYIPYIEDNATIVVVSSTSAFAPNVSLSVYCATKSYLSSLCVGLKEELKSKNINVCAVNPGMMKTKMNLESTKSVSKLPEVNVEQAAYKSLEAAKKGKGSYTTGAFYKLYRVLCKILPSSLIVKFAKLG
jgi:uncharacterized protein